MTDTAATTEPNGQGTTRLGTATIPQNTPATNQNNLTSFRAVSSAPATGDSLGPLADLPGFWQGTGFNLIARPDFTADNESGMFLELNLLNETIEFTTIGSPVLNRGAVQDDIQIFGVTYLHRVTDGTNGGALHVEPGMWLNIPPTTKPPSDSSIARLMTIPHGNAVCTVGHSEDVVFQGMPEIPPANTVPFDIDGQEPPAGTKNPFPQYDLNTPTEFRTHPIPDGITQAIVDDPNVTVRNALQGQKLTKITRLITTTAPSGAVGNIPFITTNANTLSVESVWAIEKVQGPLDAGFLQLQYSQTALLNFRGKSFPHVTVGTLVKAF